MFDHIDSTGDFKSFNDDDEDLVKYCRSCGVMENYTLCLCHKCSDMVHDYDKFRNYINNLDILNDGVLFLLESAKNWRISWIASHVNGKLLLLLSDKCDDNMIKTLKPIYKKYLMEIRELNDAINMVKELIK